MKIFEKPLTKKGRFWLWVAMAPTLITVAVALLAPRDILDRIPLLSQMLDLWMPVIPALPDYVEYSAFSQVTGAFFALAWTLLPVQVVAWLFFARHAGDAKRLASISRAANRSRLRLISLCIIALSILTAGAAFLPKDPWLNGAWGMGQSRFGLAFFGSSMFMLFCAIFSVLFFVLRNTRREDF
jgi:hypothetical protein